MDLRLSTARESAAEREAVDALLGAEDREASNNPGRDLLLPALLAVQSRAGWVSEGALNYICRRLDVAPADAYGVAGFYRMLSLTPRPPAMAYVCEDLVCRLKGSEDLCLELERRLGPPTQPHRPGNSPWQRSACLGQCDRAPAVLVTRAGVDPEQLSMLETNPSQVLTAVEGRSLSPPPGTDRKIPQLDQKALRLLRRVGRVDPSSLSDYCKHGGYRALPHALHLGPEGVLREVATSGLLGRGGAAFPTARKWEAVANAKAKTHYLVCNADESEPGTFKDRVLLEEDPFALVEAMAVSAFATGCEHGYVYIRGEYPLAAERLAIAVAQARANGFLGARILGSEFAFDLEIRQGAGAYICNSLEGYRGEPRTKPPFPVISGLFRKPTVINNVETLANIPDIVLEGGKAFASLGTKDSTGTRLFCLSGCVRRPGLYEVPLGTTLGALLDMAGSVPEGRTLLAVLLGGAAGSFVGPEDLALPLSFEGTRAAGTSLGSGAVMVFDDTVNPKELMLRLAAFFREESCGQCVPCRVGTVRQEEVLQRILRGEKGSRKQEDLALLSEISQAMRDASICGLGQTAASAIQSGLARFGDLPAEGKR
ncbi:MAG: NADH-quinone oxidoreductase subunit E [Acidobacteria bacterium]|nr:MAG: NADH-quinone oxidoreductase subunit E [Acidobacteriota bacterium]